MMTNELAVGIATAIADARLAFYSSSYPVTCSLGLFGTAGAMNGKRHEA